MRWVNHPIIKTLGPGILFASTAIGVSHLVQSTRAGGIYGYQLIGVVLLANILKYPFFEYGSRFANVTGKSIIDGYRSMGKWMLWIYFFISLLTMFFVTAAVGKVTSGFLANLLGIQLLVDYPLLADGVLLTICASILFIGQYSALDKLVKLIGSVLLISTLTAFIINIFQTPTEKVNPFSSVSPFESKEGLFFIIALMGWMPTAVDLSAWNSLWTLERIKQSGYKPSLKQTLFDFNFGYIASIILAVVFLSLGASLIYNTGKTMPDGSVAYANEVVNLYTTSMGQWSYIIIAAAAFSIMFGTAIAVLDGYARALDRTIELILTDSKKEVDFTAGQYRPLIVITALGAFLIMYTYEGDQQGFKELIDWATTLSFLVAPFIAVANFYLVMKKIKNHRPPVWLQIISYVGIIYLVGFSLFYAYLVST